MRHRSALVVDGDPSIRSLVRDVLASAGVETIQAQTGPEALEVLAGSPAVGVLVVHLKAPGVDRARFLEAARGLRPTVVPLVLGEESGKAALDLMGKGAFESLARPPEESRLALATERALLQHELLEELVRLGGAGTRRTPLQPLLGRSEAVAILRERLGKVAASDDLVLFVGEEGTGKELAARTVHALSSRRAGPFVTVDCSVPARADLAVALGSGEGGVLFLKKVGELPQESQRGLLALLRRDLPRPDARILSASNHELDRAVREDRFDGDLYLRLSSRVIPLVPLRERGGDVSNLTRHFIESICEMNDLLPIQVAPAALAFLERYPWPGNVRELRDVVESGVTMATQGILQPEHLPERVRTEAGAREAPGAGTLSRRFRETKRRVVESFERSYLEDLLAWHHGNVTAAAEQAGMLRSALQRLLRKHDLRSADFRRGSRPHADQS